MKSVKPIKPFKSVIQTKAQIFFEAASHFHHSNWKLPLAFEKMLNKLIVTPRMHGIHHADIRAETDSNFSVIFSF